MTTLIAMFSVGCSTITTGAGGLSLFTATAVDDTVTIQAIASAQTINVLGNDGGQQIYIDKVNDGLYGTVDIAADGVSVDYTPTATNVDHVYADWFQYVVKSSNDTFDIGKISIRFTDYVSDQYEPDDFQEYARTIPLQVGIPILESHTSDYANRVSPVGGDAGHAGTSAMIGGDEDWFKLTVGTSTAGAGTAQYLMIETLLPPSTSLIPHNALLVRVMDEYGFLAVDTNGLNAADYRGGAPANDSNTGTNDATTLDRPMPIIFTVPAGITEQDYLV
ncbi:MAG: hypothetical protein HRU15_03815, partial [Planctomycetes bacterium]|nr:hypothetical protein [Planctomycetota bacterium]